MYEQINIIYKYTRTRVNVRECVRERALVYDMYNSIIILYMRPRRPKRWSKAMVIILLSLVVVDHNIMYCECRAEFRNGRDREQC